jgi:hypothetical protein
MSGPTRRIFRWAPVIAALVIVACGAAGPSIAIDEETPPSESTNAARPTEGTAPTQGPSTMEECDATVAEVSLGSPAPSAIVGASQPPGEKKYFCVRVPEGTASLTFELTGAISDLNLFVAYPDLETLQQGGVWFWSADQSGAVDKAVVVEPALEDFVNAGTYYIEVSAEDFGASSPFTLTVRIP